MEHKDNLLGVIETIFKWKKIILATCIVTAVGAAIVSLLLPVYYQSTTTFYAASPDLAIPESLFGASNKAPDYYGTESDRDRLISIANSGEFATFMIDTFDLYERYDIDPESRLGPYTVRLVFAKHFQIQKTKYDALELSVEDKDREMAARMANAGRDRINFIAQKLIKESQAKILITYSENIKQKQSGISELNDSLQSVRLRYGVFNPIAQSEGLSELIAKAESKLYNAQAKLEALKNTRVPRDSITFLQADIKGYENELIKLNERLNTFNHGMASVEVMKNTQTESSERLAGDMERYKQFQAAYNSDFPAVMLLEPADIPLVKSRPKRMMIVVAATAVAIIFSILGVIIFETYREVNWREILHLK